MESSAEPFERGERARHARHSLFAMALLLAGCDAGRTQLAQIHAQQFALTGAQHVSLSVAADPGIYRVVLTEDGIDAQLRIVDPAFQAEGTLRRFGHQSVVLPVVQPSRLAIEIHGRDVARKQGRVTLTVDRLAQDPSQESDRIRAERLLSNAYQDIASGELTRSRAAQHDLQQAAQILFDNDWESEASQTQLELARLLYARLDDWEAAARTANSVAAWGRANADESIAARADVIQAAALMERAQTADELERLLGQAESLLASACRVFEERLLVLDHAECVNNQGLLDDYRGNYAVASAAYGRAAQLFQQAGDPAGEAKARQNTATVEYLSGHLSAAIDNYTRVLPLIDSQVQTDLYAAVVNNLASASAVRGDFQRALQLHGNALALYEKLGREVDAAKAVYGLGATYYLAGDPERALPYFERALPISKRGDNARVIRATLRAMGNSLSDLRRYPQALELLNQSLQFATTPAARASAVIAIAQVERQMGELKSAANRLRDLQPKVTDPSTRARLQAELARIDVQAGRASAAIDPALSAAATLEQLELGAAAADAYATAAEAQLKSGATAQALQTLDRASQLGGERNRRIWSPDLRASNAASQRRIQNLQVMASTDDARRAAIGSGAWRTFWMADSFKARSLLEWRERAAASGMQAASEPAEAEVRLAELQVRAEALMANADATDKRVVALLDEIRKLRLTLDTAPQGWRAADRRNHESDDELRRQLKSLLPDRGTVLAYHLGEPHSYAWVISSDRIDQVELPGREPIASAIKRWLPAVHATHSARTNECGAALARLILQPVAPLLSGDRLWIVPDAELNGVPFAALSASGSPCAAPLIEKFTLAYLPSVQFALNAAKQPAARRQQLSVAILADAVSAPEGPHDFPPLPASRDEATAITASLRSWNRTVLLDKDATRARLLALPFDQLTVLHLATHAHVRAATPELSALYLSGIDDREQRVPWQVTVADIRRYRVHADLVVLSACETALGRSVDGEGAIGLTHAFLSAGARAVVATDWRIADRATAQLMEDFYAALGTGTEAAAALSQAQRRARAAENSAGALREWAAFRIVDGFNR